jgi:hypothetical protein
MSGLKINFEKSYDKVNWNFYLIAASRKALVTTG